MAPLIVFRPVAIAVAEAAESVISIKMLSWPI
jgi:hypothetical protein